MDKILPTNGKEFAFYLLMMLFITATSIQAIYIHDTGVLLDAKDGRIAALEMAVDHHQAQSINHSNDAAFQRERCDAFYDVVGDYIDVTNQIKALK